MRILIRFVILFYFLINLKSVSQNNSDRLIFNHIGIHNALEKQVIRGIVKDDLGFMWFATENGLFKYDGVGYKIFRHNPDDTSSLQTNNLTHIIKDKSGMLWIAADGAGLYSLDPVSEKLTLYKNPIKPIVTNRVKWVMEGPFETIYTASYGGGLSILNKKTKQFKNFLNDEKDTCSINGNAVTSMTPGENNKTWLTLRKGGLDLFDPLSEKFTHYNFYRGQEGEHIANQVCLYKNESVFFVTNDGMYKLSLKDNKFTKFINNEKDSSSIAVNDVESIFIDSKNRIYLGVKKGIDVYDPDGNFFNHYKYNSEDPNSLGKSKGIIIFYEDDEKILWIGTAKGGLNVVYPKAVKATTWKMDPKNKNSVVSDAVFSMYLEPDNKLWIGTYGQGASCFNTLTGEFKNYYSVDKDKTTMSSGLVYSFFRDKKNYMWLSTENGLNKLNTNTGKVEKLFFRDSEESKGEKYKRIHRTVKAFEDEKNNLWVSIIQGGLLYLNPQTGEFTRFMRDEKDSTTLSDNRVFDMALDKTNNIIWLATYNGGINAFDLKTHKTAWCTVQKNNSASISHNWTFTLKIDPLTNILWIATEGGLNALDLNRLPKDRRKSHFFHFTELDGLPDNKVVAIEPDGKGNIWLSTEASVCYYMPTKKLGGTIDEQIFPKGKLKIYNRSNGLPFNGASPYAVIYNKNNKRLYVGNEGFCSFNPDSIWENKKLPPVYITEIKLFNKALRLDTSVYYKKYLELLYDQNCLSFGFAALNYIFPESNRFAYKLEGQESEWQYCGLRNFVSYTNIDPGTYVFRVKAANNDGYWNENGASITIVITPPFWKTKWFYAICIAVLLGSIVLYVKWRERHLKKEKIVLEGKVNERTRELKKEKEKVLEQKELIEEKQGEILDSIKYAKRLQNAILPSENLVKHYLPDSFILYKPKDIVAGDFYWMHIINEDHILIAAADCTGHGVPGAMVSIVCSNALNRTVKEFGITEPGKILDKTRELVIETFEKSESEVKDGMDISVCSISKLQEGNSIIKWSGANNPLWYIQNNKLMEVGPDKQPIGKYDKETTFSVHTVELKKGDSVYLFTDGYADQFGGPNGKKFKYKNFKELLLAVNNLEMAAQKIKIEKALDEWKNNLEQVDDILLIGIRI
ncbi:MAG TPA: two-component regulator propeller domain-containing protein [Bacteroidia bacterium]|jgi:ligand-binding sensor domain-containing protein/serine phosphatase RsbU (regulator of sigma subunit)|nr:two-component regulator propeller domain-containing protein [Bacteroidia bacterium]